MAGTPDMTPAVSLVRNQQAERLTRLRIVLEMSIEEAAALIGKSRHVWSRMERGATNIDAVDLARFVQAIGIPGEYVLTGSFIGLSDDLIRNLAEREARDRAVAEGRMAAVPDRPRRGRPRRKSTGHTVSEGAPAAAVPAVAVASAASRPRVPRKVS